MRPGTCTVPALPSLCLCRAHTQLWSSIFCGFLVHKQALDFWPLRLGTPWWFLWEMLVETWPREPDPCPGHSLTSQSGAILTCSDYLTAWLLSLGLLGTSEDSVAQWPRLRKFKEAARDGQRRPSNPIISREPEKLSGLTGGTRWDRYFWSEAARHVYAVRTSVSVSSGCHSKMP